MEYNKILLTKIIKNLNSDVPISVSINVSC